MSVFLRQNIPPNWKGWKYITKLVLYFFIYGQSIYVGNTNVFYRIYMPISIFLVTLYFCRQFLYYPHRSRDSESPVCWILKLDIAIIIIILFFLFFNQIFEAILDTCFANESHEIVLLVLGLFPMCQKAFLFPFT